jgi:transposase InsO family protein
VTPGEPAAQAEALIIEQLRVDSSRPAPRRLGRLSQRQARQRRQEFVRRHAVAVASDIAAVGYTNTEVADLLRITTRTLRQWRRHDAWDAARLIGRPAARSAREDRNGVLDYLDRFGPGPGLRSLCEAFPTMARAELDDLLKRYRRVWRQRHCQPLCRLHWTRPGAVWAIDFAEPPAPIDGIHTALLAVRDLASGRQLLWHPVQRATAPAAAESLAFLFAVHGPPLVVKSDNGSAFGAPAVAAVLHNFGVLTLFSPPHTPSYNGSIEAGIGALKLRTDAHAARHGRPGHWTWDDAAAACLEANATARPHGPSGPTPDALWQARASIALDERVSFGRRVEEARCEACSELGVSVTGPWPVMTERAVNRVAIRRALAEHGLLLFSRRSIPQTIHRQKAEAIL